MVLVQAVVPCRMDVCDGIKWLLQAYGEWVMVV